MTSWVSFLNTKLVKWKSKKKKVVSPKESTDALKTFANQINRCTLPRCVLSSWGAQAGLF